MIDDPTDEERLVLPLPNDVVMYSSEFLELKDVFALAVAFGLLRDPDALTRFLLVIKRAPVESILEFYQENPFTAQNVLPVQFMQQHLSTMENPHRVLNFRPGFVDDLRVPAQVSLMRHAFHLTGDVEIENLFRSFYHSWPLDLEISALPPTLRLMGEKQRMCFDKLAQNAELIRGATMNNLLFLKKVVNSVEILKRGEGPVPDPRSSYMQFLKSIVTLKSVLRPCGQELFESCSLDGDMEKLANDFGLSENVQLCLKFSRNIADLNRKLAVFDLNLFDAVLNTLPEIGTTLVVEVRYRDFITSFVEFTVLFHSTFNSMPVLSRSSSPASGGRVSPFSPRFNLGGRVSPASFSPGNVRAIVSARNSGSVPLLNPRARISSPGIAFAGGRRPSPASDVDSLEDGIESKSSEN